MTTLKDVRDWVDTASTDQMLIVQRELQARHSHLEQLDCCCYTLGKWVGATRTYKSCVPTAHWTQFFADTYNYRQLWLTPSMGAVSQLKRALERAPNVAGSFSIITLTKDAASRFPCAFKYPWLADRKAREKAPSGVVVI